MKLQISHSTQSSSTVKLKRLRHQHSSQAGVITTKQLKSAIEDTSSINPGRQDSNDGRHLEDDFERNDNGEMKIEEQFRTTGISEGPNNNANPPRDCNISCGSGEETDVDPIVEKKSSSISTENSNVDGLPPKPCGPFLMLVPCDSITSKFHIDILNKT